MFRSIAIRSIRRAGLFTSLVLAAAACSSRCGSPGSGIGSSTAGGTVPPKPVVCQSPAIAEPPACTLARTGVVGPTVGPDQTTTILSVVRSGGDHGLETDEVWDLHAAKRVATLEKGLDRAGELETAWSGDRRRVAIAGAGDSKFGFGIFDTTTWKPVRRRKDVVWFFPCELGTDPTGTRVAVTTLLGEAWIDDLKMGRTLASVHLNEMRAAGHICMPLEWGGDGELIVLEGLRTSKTLREVRRPIGVPEEVVQVLPAPAGELVAWLDRAGRVHVFEKHGRTKLQVIAAAADLQVDVNAPSGPVRGFSWKPDGGAIVTWDEKGRVRVWDPRTGDKLKDLRAGAQPLDPYFAPEEEATRLVWSPDGRSFLFNGGTGPELWSLDEGAQKLQKSGAPGVEASFPQTALFTPDGALAAAGGAVWDAKTGAFVRKVPAFRQWIDGGKFLLLQNEYGKDDAMRVLRLSDGAVLRLDRLGDDANPVILASTEEGVFQGPVELAGCVQPAAEEGAPPKKIAPEPRATLLADFWSGKPVERTCPSAADGGSQSGNP